MAVVGHHHCKSCKKKMHGVLCASKHVENGPMWCLLCKDEVSNTSLSSESSDDGAETMSRFKLKQKASGHVRHYLNNKLRKRSPSAPPSSSECSDQSSDDAGCGSAFKTAFDDLPENLKQKARNRTQDSRSETGWIPCPRCNKTHIKPTISCCNPR